MLQRANSGLGKVKVIIAPHNAHAIRATNDVPCDAYCRKVEGAFLDFYTSEESGSFNTRLSLALLLIETQFVRTTGLVCKFYSRSIPPPTSAARHGVN